MHDATSPPPGLRLAVAPGVASAQLSALLARQRAEEPGVILSFHEVAGDALLEGLHEGRYDVGVSSQGGSDPALITHPLWTENMAVAMPPQFRLIDQEMLTITDLQDYPIYRWQAETCSLLDEMLASLMPTDQKIIQRVTSFEMMALWVSAGYGVGLSAQSARRKSRTEDFAGQQAGPRAADDPAKNTPQPSSERSGSPVDRRW